MLTNADQARRPQQPAFDELHWSDGPSRRAARRVPAPHGRQATSTAATGRDAVDGATVSTACARRLESVGGGLELSVRAPTRTAVHRRSRCSAGCRCDQPSGGVRMSESRVLLVDDQDLFREGVAHHRRRPGRHGGRRRGARDGRRGGRMVDDLAPDVVLMDIRMPEIDGVEATRQIFSPERVGPSRGRRYTVRVVVLTTFDLDDRAATAIRHGASGFLLKDATPAMLRDADPNGARRQRGARAEGPRPCWRGGSPPRGRPAVVPDPHRQGARGLRRRGTRPLQHRGRPPGVPLRVDREDPRRRHPPQARACATASRSSSSPTSTTSPDRLAPLGCPSAITLALPPPLGSLALASAPPCRARDALGPQWSTGREGFADGVGGLGGAVVAEDAGALLLYVEHVDGLGAEGVDVC